MVAPDSHHRVGLIELLPNLRATLSDISQKDPPAKTEDGDELKLCISLRAMGQGK